MANIQSVEFNKDLGMWFIVDGDMPDNTMMVIDMRDFMTALNKRIETKEK